MPREGLEREAHAACRREALSVRRVTSIVSAAPGCAMSQPAVASSTITGSSPFFSALEQKMSASSVLITARKPWSMSAHAACSREEPQPKLRPATRIRQPAAEGWLSANSARGTPCSS